MGKSNLAVRLTTAGLVAPLLLVVLFLAPAWAWYIVVFVACGIAAQELFAMTHPGDAISQTVGVVSTLVLSAAIYFRSSDPRVLLTVLVLLPIVAVMVPLWRLGEIPTAGLRISAGVAGPLYIGMLLTTIGLLRRDQAASGPGFVLFSLMIAWLGDTGGYFFGRFLGKTKLYPAVSPKKTRAGFVGSLVGSSVGALLAHFWYLRSLPLADALVLAIVAGALGQLGDLVESLLKRSTGVKDSGWIIPGHGGILDRIDALLIVSGVVYLYTLWAPALRI